jgi:hypothetical protein
MFGFHKQLLVCNLALGLEPAGSSHYDMKPKPKIVIKKLQMLVSANVRNEQKV